MPDAAPFAGLRFDPAVADPATVTAPPYDVISPAERVELEASSPHNVVRLILGPLGVEDGKYSRARELLDAWIDAEILRFDDDESFYVYEERYEIDGDSRRQLGVFAAVEIGDDVLPHERVMGPVVEDRLAVIRATEANLSPVFCLYWPEDPDAGDPLEALAGSSEPYADFERGGVRHRAWRSSDPAFVADVRALLSSARVIIADGHHRYRTAEAYREERRAADGPGPWDRMMLYLVDARRHAPALLPIHRLLSGLSADDVADALAASAFVVEPATPDPDALAAAVAARRPANRCFGVLGAGRAWIASLRDEAAAREATAGEHSDAWRDLDVAVLHTLVFDRILGGRAKVTYVHHPHEAADAIAAGEAECAVLLAPTPVDAVLAVAEARDSMPPKSTFFIPKPLTGIVMRTLRNRTRPEAGSIAGSKV